MPSDRELEIQQALKKQGWYAKWRGPVTERWLWASKTERVTRTGRITIEMVDANRVTEFRAHGSVDWVLVTLAEFRETLANPEQATQSTQ